MVVHVDDVMYCHDGGELGKEVEKRLTQRFPFGTWMRVHEQSSGVTYCGKEIKVSLRDGEECVVLAQNAFIDGRLQTMKIEAPRLREPSAKATATELHRLPVHRRQSAVGSSSIKTRRFFRGESIAETNI